MNEQLFTLIPFPAPQLPAISLRGTIFFDSSILTVQYLLTGNIEDVLLPSCSTTLSRKDELWKATCFEFFLAFQNEPEYWEFNMSPSGDWNVYHMDAYRRVGFREELGISQLPFEFRNGRSDYSLDVSVDLAPLLRPRSQLQMAITAIIQTKDGHETYWALAHPAPYADFHLRESFILPLAGETHRSAQSARGV